MKRILALSTMFMMFVVFSLTSCSTEKSIASAFAKKGYQMVTLTPQQQCEMAPLLHAFPSFNHTALGYIAYGNSITCVYNADEAAWNAYGHVLVNSGFSDLGIGYSRADRNYSVTYNVSSAVVNVYDQKLLLVTYLSAMF